MSSHTLTVALEQDLSDEQTEMLIAAIRQLRGVLDVTPHEATAELWTAEQRVRHELQMKLRDVLR